MVAVAAARLSTQIDLCAIFPHRLGASAQRCAPLIRGPVMIRDPPTMHFLVLAACVLEVSADG